MHRAPLLVIAAVLACCGPASSSAPSPVAPSPTFPASESPTPTRSATPSSVPSPSAVAAVQPSAVRFADTQRGWLGVEDGILGTSDAGASWHRQLTSERITRVWSVDDTHAWALAADDVVYRSQDGEHWAPMPRTDPPIVDIDFVTPLIGWAIATPPPPTPVGQPVQLVGTLLATTDGGAVWRPVTTLALWSVCFSGARDGLGASGKRIFRTADAGRSWAQVADLTINDRGPWYPTLVCGDSRNFRAQITEPYAALSHVPYLLFATTDAGATWRLEASEGYTLGSTTPGGTLQLGSYPSLLGTLPSGHTWILTCSPPADVQDLLFLDNAGAVVRQEKAPFVACARGASFVDDAHGWAIDTSYALVGNDLRSTGRLMRTNDGGRTWVAVYPR